MNTGLNSAIGGLGRVAVFRLPPGRDLLKSLVEQAEAYGISSGIILGGAASLQRVTLRNVRSFPNAFPITDENRSYTDFEGPLELLALSGNISTRSDGSTHVHAHVVVSDGSANAYGGHLIDGAPVFTTAEVAVAEVTGVCMKRVHDQHTKALELYPEPESF